MGSTPLDGVAQTPSFHSYVCTYVGMSYVKLRYHKNVGVFKLSCAGLIASQIVPRHRIFNLI